MLKKIAAFLFILLLIQIVLYGREVIESTVTFSACAVEKTADTGDEGKDHDVDAYIEKLGIKTEVNEEELEEKYPGAKIYVNPENGNTTIKFHNPDKKNYRLDIYDINKGLVASFVNVSANQVELEREFFDVGAYIYKLVGENNTYCGTFMLR